MDDYIERKALENKLNSRLAFLRNENGNYDHYTDGYDEAVCEVEDFPAADVAPVVHGRWIINIDELGTEYTVCSACRSYFEVEDDYGCSQKMNFRDMAYCPKCGAKMDGCEESAAD